MHMTIEEIKAQALAVAEEMKRTNPGPLPKDLRRRFIEVRSALFQRGIFDPVLVRFDSATVNPASTAEIAEQLARIGASLRL